ncbi:Protein archease [Manis javanica]|nr:Protein archease [Manis javanica]
MAVVTGAANNETYKQTNSNGPSTALHQDKGEVTEKMLKGPQDGGSSNSQRDCPSDLEIHSNGQRAKSGTESCLRGMSGQCQDMTEIVPLFGIKNNKAVWFGQREPPDSRQQCQINQE